MAINSNVWITAHDYNRLRLLLADLMRQSRGVQAGLQMLEDILDLARVVQPEELPGNVVTMNSHVLFEDLDTHEKESVSIVYPAQTDPASGKISILSPVGAALLGEAEGSELELPLPHGRTRRIRIESVLYQPEAQGDFTL